jgi:hypothetical protein
MQPTNRATEYGRAGKNIEQDAGDVCFLVVVSF